MPNKTTVHIKSVEVLVFDTFFNVEINYMGETSHDTLVAESLEELIKRDNVEVTYDEEYEMDCGTTIEQLVDRLDFSCAEVTDLDTDGEFDVYLHKVTAKHGEITYDMEGEFIKTYKNEKRARTKALTIASKII